MRLKLLVSVAVCIGLAACTPKPSDTTNTASDVAAPSSAAPAVDTTPAPVAQPTHNYTSVDNGTYLYAEALSDDDVKAGKAAGGFVGFKYLGEMNGVYMLQPENSDQVDSCTNPCTVIKVTVDGELTDRVQYVPGSILAAAFDDAFAGQLTPQVNVPTYGPPATDTTQPADGQATS